MEKFTRSMADIIIEKGDSIVMIKRLADPFRGMLGIPGGKVDYNETVEEAAVREAFEETSVKVRIKGILGVYSAPGRDPRFHSISTVFIAEPIEGEPKGGDDAEKAFWQKVDEIDTGNLMFDHGKLIEDYRKWKKGGGTFWSGK